MALGPWGGLHVLPTIDLLLVAGAGAVSHGILGRGWEGGYDNRGRHGRPDGRGDRGGTGTVLRYRGFM